MTNTPKSSNKKAPAKQSDAISTPRKSLWVPTVFTICAVITLLVLGTWQVLRLQWKMAIVETIQTQAALAAVDLPDEVELPEWKYRHVLLQGQFHHDQEIHLFTGPRVMKGDTGYNILTPMTLLDGRQVLVDRGWVPATHKKQEKRLESLVAGAAIPVEGMIHKGEQQAMFTPDNNIDGNLWFWIDMQAASSATGFRFPDYYIRAIKPTSDATYPIPGEVEIKQRNDHLQYAITWYGLAIIALVIYVLFVRKYKQDSGSH